MAVLFVLREALRSKEFKVGGKKSWIVGLSVSFVVVVWVSWGAWTFYLNQDDAPKGIIPELNLVFCALLTLAIVGITMGIDRLSNFPKPNK